MKHKTAELEGALLDAAVAMAEGFVRTRSQYGEKPALWDTGGGFYRVDGVPGLPGDERWRPSTHWDHAGPIIERKNIATVKLSGVWRAFIGYDPTDWLLEVTQEQAVASGPTALIAAMRAHVAWQLGDEVELP